MIKALYFEALEQSLHWQGGGATSRKFVSLRIVFINLLQYALTIGDTSLRTCVMWECLWGQGAPTPPVLTTLDNG